MVATVQIYEANGGINGAPGSKTRVDGQGVNAGTDVRFCTADAYNDVMAHPCVVPSSGDNYSYWKHLYLDISGAFTKINNIKVYSDGEIGWALGTGGECRVGVRDANDNGCPFPASYEVAGGTIGTTGYDIEDVTNGHGYYKGQTTKTVDIAGYASDSALAIDSSDYIAADESDAAVFACKITTTATQGTQSQENIFWVYDEI